VQRLSELGNQRIEQARAEATELVDAGRAQVQQEIEAARGQAQQELAQWKANVEREITDRRAAVDRELARQRTLSEQKIAALHAEAQQFAADVRRRANEQAAAAEEQLVVVQQEIQGRQAALTELRAELESGEHRLSELVEQSEDAQRELSGLTERLAEVRDELAGQLERLDAARQGSEKAERHATDVRARVQREAKRMAEMAAAAVMAAATGNLATGEFPMVTSRLTSGTRISEDQAHPLERPQRLAPPPVAEEPEPVAVEQPPAPPAADPEPVAEAADERDSRHAPYANRSEQYWQPPAGPEQADRSGEDGAPRRPSLADQFERARHARLIDQVEPPRPASLADRFASLRAATAPEVDDVEGGTNGHAESAQAAPATRYDAADEPAEDVTEQPEAADEAPASHSDVAHLLPAQRAPVPDMVAADAE
jgi:hypothetical protein